MKNISQPRPHLQQQYAALRQSLALMGYISDGSVVDRARLKPPRTGFQWTRKVGQKTVTVALSAEQFQAMKQAIQNRRRLRKTVRPWRPCLAKSCLPRHPTPAVSNPSNSKTYVLSKRHSGSTFLGPNSNHEAVLSQ